MKKIALIAGLVVLTATALPALAGECSHETQTCLNYLAQNMGKRGWAGVDLNEETMEVTDVFPDTPAARAGVKTGDVLVAINGVRLNDGNEEALHELWGQMKPGKTFDYTVTRRGKEKEIRLTLAAMPEEAIARIVGEHMLDHAEIEVASK